MSKLKEFTVTEARPLPVILLLDTSGSMSKDAKIDVMNRSVREMLSTFAEDDSPAASIWTGVICFGGRGASWHQELMPAHQAATAWTDLSAGGKTPLGGAIEALRLAVENKEVIPSRAYRPTAILVSDGIPTDDWGGPMAELLASERARKADRHAMAIGSDADHTVLGQFVSNESGGRVFEAHEAGQIQRFFRFVTMTVTSRSRSSDPNTIVPTDPDEFDDFDY